MLLNPHNGEVLAVAQSPDNAALTRLEDPGALLRLAQVLGLDSTDDRDLKGCTLGQAIEGADHDGVHCEDFFDGRRLPGALCDLGFNASTDAWLGKLRIVPSRIGAGDRCSAGVGRRGAEVRLTPMQQAVITAAVVGQARAVGPIDHALCAHFLRDQPQEEAPQLGGSACDGSSLRLQPLVADEAIKGLSNGGLLTTTAKTLQGSSVAWATGFAGTGTDARVVAVLLDSGDESAARQAAITALG